MNVINDQAMTEPNPTLKISDAARTSRELISHHVSIYRYDAAETERIIQRAMNAYAQEVCKPLVEAITGLLKSADCHWYESNAGHDWRFAIDVAMVELRAHRLDHGPEEKE